MVEATFPSNMSQNPENNKQNTAQNVSPSNANVIPNIYGGFQGFILDTADLTLSVLPYDFKQIKTMCDKYVLPYLESKLGVKKTRLTLKYFGEKEDIEKRNNDYIDDEDWSLLDYEAQIKEVKEFITKEEAINFLKGDMPKDLKEVVLELGANMLQLAGKGSKNNNGCWFTDRFTIKKSCNTFCWI